MWRHLYGDLPVVFRVEGTSIQRHTEVEIVVFILVFGGHVQNPS